MRIKDGYALRKVADSAVIVSVEELDNNYLMTLNQSGVDLWEMLQTDCTSEELVRGMLELYEVDSDVLLKDVECFLQKLREADLLEE